MTEYDNLPNLCGPLPLDSYKFEIPAEAIPTTEFVRPC